MKKLFFGLIILLFYSCEYELQDDFYNNIDKDVDKPTATVELNFATDTLYLSYPSYIDFKIEAGNHKFNWVNFYINNIKYGTYYSSTGSFEISPSRYNYTDGTYQIKIEAFSNSGTGSIADCVGSEGFLFTYNWVMVISDDANLSPQIKKICRDNGKLRLDWSMYKSTNFKKYLILKSNTNNDWDTIIRVYDQHTTSAYDPSYIGEEAIYAIRTIAGLTLFGRSLEYKDTVPQLKISNYGDKSFKLKWKSYFSNNVAGYIISEVKKDVYGYNYITTLPATDSTYIFQNGKFGVESELMLTTIPKNTPSYFSDEFNRTQYYSSKCKGIIGKKSFNVGQVYVPNGNSLIYRTSNAIFLYDYNTRKNSDSLIFSNSFQIGSVSPDGNYILGVENSTNFFVYNVSTKTKKNVSFSDITGSLNYYYFMAMANTGVAVLCTTKNYYVYDFVNNNLITSRTDFDYWALYLTISADGKYFSNGYNYFFKIEGNAIVQLPDITNNLYYYNFNPCNPEEVIEYTPNGSIQFINILDRSVSKSIPISCDVIQNIDFKAGKILGSTKSEFKVYDLNSGSLLWSYPTFSQTNFVSYQFQLCKDVIYWYEGYLIYL